MKSKGVQLTEAMLRSISTFPSLIIEAITHSCKLKSYVILPTRWFSCRSSVVDAAENTCTVYSSSYYRPLRDASSLILAMNKKVLAALVRPCQPR